MDPNQPTGNEDHVEPVPPSPVRGSDFDASEPNIPVQFTTGHVQQLLDRLQTMDQNFAIINERMNQFGTTLNAVTSATAG